MIYNVTCNTDDNYAQHCCAMLCSLFENNKGMEFHVHILTSHLSDRNRQQICSLCQRYNCQYTIYEVDESRLEGVQFRQSRPLTKAAYYRILLPEILDTNIERVLYLDCDMIILGSVDELYELEIDNYALAATLDCMPWNSIHRRQLKMEADERSFCSGIMMINLKYWREHDAVNKLVKYSKKKREPVYLHDQDSFNYVFQKQWYLIPPKWNRPSFSFLPKIDGLQYFDIYEFSYEPKVVHFSSEAKPWLNMRFPYSNKYKYYLNLSGYENSVFKKVSMKDRIKFTLWNFKYVFRKFIYPLIPNIIIILLKDIIKIISFVFNVFNLKNLQNLLLKENIRNLK